MAFRELKPLATKIVNALAVSGAFELNINNAKQLTEKCRVRKPVQLIASNYSYKESNNHANFL